MYSRSERLLLHLNRGAKEMKRRKARPMLKHLAVQLYRRSSEAESHRYAASSSSVEPFSAIRFECVVVRG